MSERAGTCYRLNMAQVRKRPPVTLTLDPEIRSRAEAVLAQLPGKASLSQLVDELLLDFVETTGPLVEEFRANAGGDPTLVVRQLLGEQMLALSAEAAEFRDALAARAAKESEEG